MPVSVFLNNLVSCLSSSSAKSLKEEGRKLPKGMLVHCTDAELHVLSVRFARYIHYGALACKHMSE